MSDHAAFAVLDGVSGRAQLGQNLPISLDRRRLVLKLDGCGQDSRDDDVLLLPVHADFSIGCVASPMVTAQAASVESGVA